MLGIERLGSDLWRLVCWSEPLTDKATLHVTQGHRKSAMPDLVDAIGHTPLIELDLATELASGTRLFAKLESANPGGSLKDRCAYR